MVPKIAVFDHNTMKITIRIIFHAELNDAIHFIVF